MADSTAMTIDFLRARLLAERSVSRASKERADQLAARVSELEEQVRAVTAERRQAERAAEEVLVILESQGFCGHLSDVVYSGSDNDGDEEESRDARGGGDAARFPREEQEPAAAQDEADQHAVSGTAQPGGLSWKGRSVSPRKATQLKQKHRRSYFYLLASDSSPKYRIGQSCRKNKRKELRSAAPEEESGSAAVHEENQTRPRDGSDCAATDDGRADLDGEVGGDEQSSGDGNGGQYVIRYEKDGEVERVLERQAELIRQYAAEEKAQRDWEKQFKDNRNSPKGDIVVHENGHTSERRDTGAEHGHGCAWTAPVSARGSSNNSTATRQNQHRGDEDSDRGGRFSSYNTNSVSSGHRAMIKSPSESSPSGDTHTGQVSDWGSSNFYDHIDDAASCRQPSSTVDVVSVLEALHRAKMSLREKLSRPLPPSQVTLALPAPGDEYREEDDSPVDYGSYSYREELGSCASPDRQEILALPAPEDCHYHDHERVHFSVDGADTSLAEKPSSSSPPRQEILALPAPGDDCPGEIEVSMKIPNGTRGLFRLPTDSFPKDETLSGSNVSYDSGSSLTEVSGVSAMQRYDPHSSELVSLPTSGRCSIPSSDLDTSFVCGIPGRLAEDLRRGGRPLGDANLFMQRGCDYTVSNKLML